MRGKVTNWIGCVLILSLTAAGCQTSGPKEDPETRRQNIVESQKAVIMSALDGGRADAAMQSLRAMLRDYPDDASLHNLMGLAQLALKNPVRAIRSFKRAYDLDPQTAIGLNLTSAYLESGDYAKAVSFGKKLLEGEDGDEDGGGYRYKERLFHNIGYGYVRQKQYAKAQQWFLQAIEENPAFFPSHLELARLYENTNRPAMAAKAYRQATDYCSLCYEPVQALATLLVKLGRYSDARLALLRFTKTEGINERDRTAANQQLRNVTTAGLVPTKRGG